MPLSRLYSTVSTSPRRTVTDWPTAADTSTSASEAPRSRATSSERRATCAMASLSSGRAAEGMGWSGMERTCGGMRGGGRPRQKDGPGSDGKVLNSRGGGHRRKSKMDEEDFISKTRRKRESAELQDIGAELVKLSPEQLARLDLPESLREAVLACQGITKHEARRRQMQWIGKLMRNVDAAPIAEKLASLQQPTKKQTAL